MGTTLFQGFHFPIFDQSFFMISAQIQNILTTGIGHIGCASSSLKPFHSNVLGVICEQNSSEIACCLNKEYSEPFLNNLVVGSMVSLFVGAISHEAYNVKGHVTAIRDVQENEKKACDKLRNGIYEPFAALDPQSVRMIQQIIVSLQMFERISIAISDHSSKDLLSCCDSAQILSEGKIVAKGSPQELVRDSRAIQAYFGEGYKF